MKFASLLMIILASATIALAQETRIDGRVVDPDGNPLVGVSVVEVGSTDGASTDVDGNFDLQSNIGSPLEFSYIGYETVTMPAAKGMNVTLAPAAQVLEEMVVIGYGVQKKANLTGAVASVGGDDIVKSRQANSTNSLAGQVSGVLAKQSSGEPGADSSTIQIRGIATFTGGTSPSYIIDGIERSADDFARINPADIESINVLKDAASASIFGMRGANGVILVTTKRGDDGKSIVKYNGTVSIQTPVSLPQFASSYDYARLMNVYMNEEVYTDEQIKLFKDGTDPDHYPNTNWYDEVLSDHAIQHQHDLSASGGNDKIKYFASAGYLNQEGMWEGLGYERFSLRSNIDAQITKTTRLALDISGRNEITNGTKRGSSSLFQEIVRNTPVLVAQYQNGLYAVPDATHPNIAADQGCGYTKNDEFAILTRAELDQKLSFITKGLSAKAILSYDKNVVARKSWGTDGYLYILNGKDDYQLQNRGSANLSQSNYTENHLETQLQLNYNRDFGANGDHSVSGLLMFLTRQSDFHSINVSRNSYDSDVMDQINAGNEDGQKLGGYDTASARMSYVGRVNYAYKDKYMFEANMRRDASENFAPAYRWGTFSSVSAAWIVSEEKFFAPIKEVVSYFKVRGSIGTLGNDNTGGVTFPYYSRFNLYGGGGGAASNLPNNLGDYTFGDLITKGLYPGAIANEKATWETSTKRNIAFDFGLYNMFNFSVDLFNENRTNILAQRNVQIPGSFGANLPLENIGEVYNHGVDASMNFHYSLNDDFVVLAGGNLTFARNEIVYMAEAEGTNPLLCTTGRPIGGYYGYKTDGIFKTQQEIDDYAKQQVAGDTFVAQPGDIKYVDVSGDGVVNADDRTYLGVGNMPEITYGFNVGFNYKNLDFTALFQGATNVQVHLTGGLVQPYYNSGNLPQMWVDGAWSADNADATLPRLAVSTHNFLTSDVVDTFLYDASYLRLKNIEIGYTLPRKFLDKININNARIFVNGNNLLTFTDVPQIDPENTSSLGWNYPQIMSFNAGINIEF